MPRNEIDEHNNDSSDAALLSPGEAKQTRGVPRPKTALRENVEAIVVALVLALIVRTFVFQAFKIPSGSMRDTLLEGDHILVNKCIYMDRLPFGNMTLFPVQYPQRGEILVFKYPEDPDRDFIKRCVATGGDHLTIRDTEVKIDDVQIDERAYAKYDQQSRALRSGRIYSQFNTFGPRRISDGFCFMMGDNRDNSKDSRYWGELDNSLIKGKAFLIYLSVEDGSGAIWKRIRWKRLFSIIH